MVSLQHSNLLLIGRRHTTSSSLHLKELELISAAQRKMTTATVGPMAKALPLSIHAGNASKVIGPHSHDDGHHSISASTRGTPPMFSSWYKPQVLTLFRCLFTAYKFDTQDLAGCISLLSVAGSSLHQMNTKVPTISGRCTCHCSVPLRVATAHGQRLDVAHGSEPKVLDRRSERRTCDSGRP